MTHEPSGIFVKTAPGNANGIDEDTFAEKISRAAFPDIWKKIDANIADDDWNGGTALNLRSTLLSEAKLIIRAIKSETGVDFGIETNRPAVRPGA